MSSPRFAPKHGGRALRWALTASLSLPGAASAQDEPDAPPVEFEEPPPPAFEPPPLPPPDADFSADNSHFGETLTPPEEVLRAERDEQRLLAAGVQPLYLRQPAFDIVTESAAGLFAAGIVGLLFGSIGGAIDEGESSQPLGGIHGPAIGGLAGTFLGTSLGVWGAGQLFERDVDAGWAFLGSGVGTVVGGGLAFGLAVGFEDNENIGGLAAVLLLVSQTAGALLFQDAFTEEWKPGLPDTED